MRRVSIALIGILSIGAMIAGAGIAAASPSPAAAGTEHFQFASVSATSNRLSAIATGVFTAGGVLVSTSHGGTVRLTGGTFKVNHHAKRTKTRITRSCLFSQVQHGTFRLHSGTGRYRHIRGSGTFISRILAVFPRNSSGKCSESKLPVAFQQVINAHGHVTGA